MSNTFYLQQQNPNQFNPAEHPAVFTEIGRLFRSLFPFAAQNKASLLARFLRHHSINRMIASTNPPLFHNIVNGTTSTSATESLFAVNEGNQSFCNDLEAYIGRLLR
ncbi:MAG: hypothetical protein LCH58_05670 [Bacteroidetes bacterium]|uniref:hypothetical protein n=1 Tax=Phnomibacter sp. TaxID=2836217 RepID=UPI002FDEE459|nr:hypothetical protein [Bacteroidota bacterium]